MLIQLSTVLSDELKQFREDLEKYHKMAKQMREETLKKERKMLTDQEKSPKLRYYDGSKSDRIKHLDLEMEILEQIEQLAAAKQK